MGETRHSAIYLLHDVVKNREAKGVAFRLRVPSLRIDRGEILRCQETGVNERSNDREQWPANRFQTVHDCKSIVAITQAEDHNAPRSAATGPIG